jgi:hypothetical protein
MVKGSVLATGSESIALKQNPRCVRCLILAGQDSIIQEAA